MRNRKMITIVDETQRTLAPDDLRSQQALYDAILVCVIDGKNVQNPRQQHEPIRQIPQHPQKDRRHPIGSQTAVHIDVHWLHRKAGVLPCLQQPFPHWSSPPWPPHGPPVDRICVGDLIATLLPEVGSNWHYFFSHFREVLC